MNENCSVKILIFLRELSFFKLGDQQLRKNLYLKVKERW